MITVASPTQVSGPGPKSRLSLDLSSLPPSYSAINSPTSPALSLEPSSPTLSGSFCVNKSNAELTGLLKDAYNMIKEKERDLTLAAEIGKSLLENNNALKIKYESLVADFRKLQRRQTTAQSHAVQGKERDGVTRMAPPSGSILDPFAEEPSDYYDDSDSDSTTGVSSGLSIADAYLVRRSRSPRRYNNVNFKELEQIRELESINQDLQARLDIKINEMNENEKTNRAKNRKLENELERLQQAAGLADQKIEELERENLRLVEKQKTDFWNLRRTKKSENEDVVEELLQKVQELEEQNTVVERAKADIEKRLQRTLKELSILQEKSAVLEDAEKECANLHDVLLTQSQQIQELNMSLEEQRQINLGMRSGFHSRSNSISDGTLIRRVSQPDTVRALLLGGTPASPGGQKFSLLEEMENAWYRDLAMFQRDRKKGGQDDDASSVTSEYDLQEFLKRNGVRPDEDDISCIDYLSDEEFTFLEEFEEDETTALRRREWFWKRWFRAVLRFFLAIWRWCRFVVLIGVAVLMALYRGPDAVLPPIEM